MRSGWVKIWHKLADNELWLSEPFTKGQAWVDLLLLANAKTERKYYKGSYHVFEAGTIYISISDLSKRWKWSQGKTKRFLKMLENDSKVRLKIEERKGTAISLVGWGFYQLGGEENEEQTEKKTKNKRRSNGDNKEDIRRYKKNKEDIAPQNCPPDTNEEGYKVIDFGYKDRNF